MPDEDWKEKWRREVEEDKAKAAHEPQPKKPKRPKLKGGKCGDGLCMRQRIGGAKTK